MNRILLRKTLRDLRAALAQTSALIIIVTLGISSFVALTGAYRDLGTSYNRTYQDLHFADVTFAVQAAPQQSITEITQIAGVAAVTGRLVIDTGMQLPAGATADGADQIRARLIGIPAAAHPQVNDVLITGGRYLAPQDMTGALLESHFADVYHLHAGDTVTPILNGQKVAFQVVGVAASPEYLIVSPSKQEIIPSARTFAVLFIPLAEAQKLASAPGMINEIAVRLNSGADTNTLIQQIQQKLAPYGLQATTLQADQPSNAALQLDLEGYREIADLMPLLILLVAAASVYIMLGRQIRAQQPQIGLMKALGYTNRAVMEHYLALALVIGGIGSILGIALGLPLVRLITTSYAAELGIPLVQTRFYPDLVLEGVVVSLVVAVLAGWGPARASARMAPAEAMRLDPATALANGGLSPVERLVRLPFWARLPLRNVFRVRSRSISTGMGIIFAFILILTAWGMLDSMQNVLDRTFGEVQRWDAVAIFDAPQTTATLDKIKSWPGVTGVTPLIQFPATLKSGSQKDDILLTALPPDQQMQRLQLPQGVSASQALTSGKIVLSKAMADKYHLNNGDLVTLDTPLGSRQLALSSVSDEMISAVAYVSLDEAEKWMGSPAQVFNSLYLSMDPAQAHQIQTDLYHLPGATSVQMKADIQKDWISLMGLYNVFMGVILAFAVAMAFALLFNVMTVGVLERQREFATMRAVGASQGRIAMLLTTENVVLWLLTLIPGLLLGHWAAVQMGASFSSDLFALTIVNSPASYVLTAIGILVTMILAALPAIRRVNGLNLAEATKVLT